MRALLFYALIAGFTPVVGIVVGGGLLGGFHEADLYLPAGEKWSDVCVLFDFPDIGRDRMPCINYFASGLAFYGGLALAAAVAAYTGVLLAAAALVGRDPVRLGLHFNWSTGFFVTSWSLMAIPRALVLATSAYLAWIYYFHPPIGEFWGRILLAALVGGIFSLVIRQIGAAVRFWRPVQPAPSLAVLAERSEAPDLYRFVDSVARRVGTTPPEWLAVTVDSDFAVTEGEVTLPDHDQPVTGGVMFLSAPMLRVLSAEEAGGIVAHELGHLTDPVSQAKAVWGPTYGAVLAEINNSSALEFSERWHLGIVPAAFSRAVRESRRQAETNADAATLKVARPLAAVRAFLKAIVMDEANGDQANENFERLLEGVAVSNLSVDAATATITAIANVDSKSLARRIRSEYHDDALEFSIVQRIENFGMPLEVAVKRLTGQNETFTPAPVGDLAALEERATRVVHRFQQALAGDHGPLEAEEVERMAAFLSR